MVRKTVTTEQLRRIVSTLGYLPNGKKTAITYSYTIYTVLHLTNLIFGLYHEWSDFKVRLEIIRDLVLLCNLQVYWYAVPDVYILLDIFERHKKRLMRMNNFKEISRRFYGKSLEMENYSHIFLKVFAVNHFLYSYLPVLKAIYIMLTSESGINFKDLPHISYFYYPMAEVTFIHYCFGTMFMYSGLLCASFSSFCVIFSSYLSLHCIVAAFSQLRTYIMEWDRTFAGSVETDAKNNLNSDGCENGMADSLREIVIFHQEICCEARLLNKGLERSTMNLLQGCIVQLCLSIFSIIEGDDKVKYGGFIFSILTLLVLFAYFGQILKDKIGIIQMTIWESCWVDKPASIKKTLYIMMIGASVEIEIKPYGVQGLDMQSVGKVLKTVYSLFNVINHTK